MATTVGGTQSSCFFCGYRRGWGGGRHFGCHYRWCPTLDPSGVYLDEWDRGYAYGLNGHNIPDHERWRFSESFVSGWAKGKAESERAAEVAFYSNYGYELTEEEWDDWSG